MATRRSKPFTVLVGVDYSELGTLALVAGIDAAKMHERSHVHVVHALAPLQSAAPASGVPYVTALDEPTTAEAAAALHAYVQKIVTPKPGEEPAEGGGPSVLQLTAHIRGPYPAEAIAQLASDVEADLVVVGTHGRRGVARFLLGSVAEGVVRLAPCPVLVVRPTGVALDSVPKIEPPCPRCVETRRASDGSEFWCAQHREHHERRHTYHFGPVRSGHQSGFLFPMTR